MKKISLYSLITVFCTTTILLSSCKNDFLQLDSGVGMPLDSVFSDPTLAVQFADNSYNFLTDDYMRLGPGGANAATSEFTDETCEGTADDRQIQAFNLGNFNDALNVGNGPFNEGAGVYARMYGGIRNATLVLENFDKVRWTSAAIAERVKGEQYFLRAYFYFELMKRYGGVVIMNKTSKVDEDIDKPRSSYQTVLDSVLMDLDKADELLPLDYDAANTGRATVGASKALRSRVLLYAASERENPGSVDKSKWQMAANAAKAVMDMNKYSLHTEYAGLMQAATSPEFIMIKIRAPRSAGSAYIMSNGSGGTYSNFNPTQGHVDLYEMNNGKPITDPTSGYDSTKPYINRDPRFAVNILYNDATWQGRKMEMWEDTIGLGTGGAKKMALDYVTTTSYTSQTRYYCKKMWPDVFKSGSTQKSLLNYFFFRYAEILLNYAEAQNEAVGPDASVYNAIKLIRVRAGMPELPAGLTQTEMRKRICNERAIELAFEDHRWFDILRWKAGIQLVKGPVFGMDVKLLSNGTFKYRKIQLPTRNDRKFEDYMHYYPIPLIEIQKSNGTLKQNPGW